MYILQSSWVGLKVVVSGKHCWAKPGHFHLNYLLFQPFFLLCGLGMASTYCRPRETPSAETERRLELNEIQHLVKL